MDFQLEIYLLGGLFTAGLIIGIAAVRAADRRSRRARLLGAISLALLITPLLAAMAVKRRVYPWSEFARFSVLLIPGAIALIVKPKPLIPPGHCTTCGYNLTGNVSGKCSECGEPVPAP